MVHGAVTDKLTSLGYTLVDDSQLVRRHSGGRQGDLHLDAEGDVGTAELNALKQFASEGGRLVVVGENSWFYGDEGIAIENELLANLGSQLVNQGDCFFGFGIAESDHQLVSGVAQVELPCASTMTPGPTTMPWRATEVSGKMVIAVTRDRSDADYPSSGHGN